MPDDSLIPFNDIPNSGVDLNLAINQARQLTSTMDAMGIEKATFKSGAVFQRNPADNSVTVVADGLLVEQREHSTSVTFRHEGSTPRQVTEELNSRPKPTQEVMGAFSNRSQPWTSRLLSEDDE